MSTAQQFQEAVIKKSLSLKTIFQSLRADASYAECLHWMEESMVAIRSENVESAQSSRQHKAPRLGNETRW